MDITEKKIFTLKIVLIMGFTAVLLLTAIFFALTGVHVYEMSKTRETTQIYVDAASYFKEEIRKSDGNVVRTASLGGLVSALVIEDYRDGQYYETWYFLRDGYLQKAAVQKGTDVSAADTEPVLALSAADFSMPSEDLLRISFTSPEKDAYVFHVHIPDYIGGA